LFDNEEAYLPPQCYGTSDVDVILSAELKAASLVFSHCNNGGGVVLTSYTGLQWYHKSK
jgi:hypothetical protein